MIAVAAVGLVAGVSGAALVTSSPASSVTDAGSTPIPTPSAPAGSLSPGSQVPGRSPGSAGPMGGAGPVNGGGFSAGPGGVVHGQVMVPGAGGRLRKEDIQTGQVTAVSSSSLTVRSTDGYTKSYRVTSATQVDAGKTGIGSVKVGHQVAVTATVRGSTASLTQILDLSLLGHGTFTPPGGQPAG